MCTFFGIQVHIAEWDPTKPVDFQDWQTIKTSDAPSAPVLPDPLLIAWGVEEARKRGARWLSFDDINKMWKRYPTIVYGEI